MQNRQNILLLLAIFAIRFGALPLFAQNTNNPNSNDFEMPDMGGAIAFLLLGIVFVGVFVILLGMGIAAGLLLCAIAGALMAFGILSSSVLIGFVRRSPASAFRALFLQIGAVAGVTCGIASTWLVAWLFHYNFSVLARLLAGTLCGLAGGILIAWMFNVAWSKIAAWILARFDRNKTNMALIDV